MSTVSAKDATAAPTGGPPQGVPTPPPRRAPQMRPRCGGEELAMEDIVAALGLTLLLLAMVGSFAIRSRLMLRHRELMRRAETEGQPVASTATLPAASTSVPP